MILGLIHGSHGVSEIGVECVCGDVFPWSLILLRSDVITASLSFGVDQLRKNYETYNRGEGFQLFARKIRQERSKGNHFLVLIYLLSSINYCIYHHYVA